MQLSLESRVVSCPVPWGHHEVGDGMQGGKDQSCKMTMPPVS